MYYACAVWSAVWKRRLPAQYLTPNYGCLYAMHSTTPCSM